VNVPAALWTVGPRTALAGAAGPVPTRCTGVVRSVARGDWTVGTDAHSARVVGTVAHSARVVGTVAHSARVVGTVAHSARVVGATAHSAAVGILAPGARVVSIARRRVSLA
jgi:hypothetical protein